MTPEIYATKWPEAAIEIGTFNSLLEQLIREHPAEMTAELNNAKTVASCICLCRRSMLMYFSQKSLRRSVGECWNYFVTSKLIEARNGWKTLGQVFFKELDVEPKHGPL